MPFASVSRRRFLSNSAGAAGAAQTACQSDRRARTDPLSGAWSDTAPEASAPNREQPIEQKGNNLNLIVICADTWGAHTIGAYGNPWIRTPNLDRLASKSAIFLDHYPESLATIPARRVIYTGRRVFPAHRVFQPDDTGGPNCRGWHQLYAEDITLAEMLAKASYTTALVSDLFHTFKPGKNFHRGFACWQWIRGQEADRAESGPAAKINLRNYLHASQQTTPDLSTPHNLGILQYLLNRQKWKGEEDWLCAQTFREAMRWLDRNASEKHPFYLHVESFSPHEYWDPFDDYYHVYMKKDYKGPRLVNPPGTTKVLSEVEFEHSKSLYYGLVSMVDAWLGKFLEKVESLGLLKNTIVVFLTDHGTMMGEQGQIHKGETRIRTQVTHVPLILYDPRRNHAGRKIRGYVQHTDLAPTLLELLDLKPPKRVTGGSVVPLLTGAAGENWRDAAITGWSDHAAVRTREWSYITRWAAGTNEHEQLYNVRDDPAELKNVVSVHPAAVQELRKKLATSIEAGRNVTKGSFHIDMA
jgi:arylsulfatase A-like enzyme